VITNIDHEHLENYGGFADLQQAFVDFANKTPFYGSVVACVDDANLAELLPKMTSRIIPYGLAAAGAEITARDVDLRPLGVTATVMRRERRVRRPTLQEQLDSWDAPKTERRAADSGNAEHRPFVPLGTLTLNVPGRHNLLNALAAVAVAGELGLSFDRIAAGLADFQGAERRFEVRGEPRGILLVDDYGHHPTEIAAVLAAAKTLNRRIVVAFQPHRYSRTASLMDAFGPALAGADHVVLTDIYAASEEPIPGVTLEALAESVRTTLTVPLEVVPKLDDVVTAIVRAAKPGDVVITLGAGSIGSLPDRLLLALDTGFVGDRP